MARMMGFQPLSIAGVVTLTSAVAPVLGQPNTGKNMSQRVQQTVALLKAIETGEQAAVAVVNPDKYIQHNLAIADGLVGFGELLKQVPKGSARVHTMRAFEDGDFVLTHTEYNFLARRSASTSSGSKMAASSNTGTTCRRLQVRIRVAIQ
jgi:predicted SnoaL-like aldol condensation-catalyzing enzyme